MNRTSRIFDVPDMVLFQHKALFFTQHQREVLFLNNNKQDDAFHSYEALLAFDAFTSMETDAFHAFEKLKEYQEKIQDWLFGYLTYDIKNEVENLSSLNFDGLGFSDLLFFQPKKLLLFTDTTVQFLYLNICKDEIQSDFESILQIKIPDTKSPEIHIQQRITKETYIEKVNLMKDEIRLGNIYEANFCMEFFGEEAELEPLSTYWTLNAISEPPFSCYLKANQLYAMSASPERYLKRTGNHIVSQPIKGTAKRDPDEQKDEELKHCLQHDEKERAENVMIVDLVRNDLSKTAIRGSVKVKELFGVYSFKQVHQMISTITSVVTPETTAADILKTTFPMGSMTGAPKLSAMQVIERLEATKRGLYSGAIGYFTPENDFDFNVVIRTILYNKATKYVSFSVGSAITFQAKAETEYEECLLKAKAMQSVLGC